MSVLIHMFLVLGGVALITTTLVTDDRRYHLLRQLKHDRSSFTQGLVQHNGYIYESAGLYGRSSIRVIDPVFGTILKKVNLERKYFAEGITVVDDRIMVLTYHEKTMLIFNADSLKLLQTLKYRTVTGEGWGLTNDGQHLIASDGSQVLSVYKIPSVDSISPLEKVKEIIVVDGVTGEYVHNVNELQYVNGYIFANIWFTDTIVKINYSTGVIEERFDMSALYPLARRSPNVDVFNGIAYNSSDDTFIVTGKMWPRYYHVRLKTTSDVSPARADLL